MIIPVSLKNQSIDSSGITSDYKTAISEYIWNGFEANATKISIEYTLNEAFGVKELIVKDNGDGINYNELGETFGAFLASKKNLMSLQMKSKANKGKGRFSFIAFSNNAEWHTVYKDNSVYKEYDITMSSDKKEVIDCSEPQLSEKNETGTEVKFFNINTLTAENMSFGAIEPTLLKEFAWFLYLYKNKNVEIVVNGKKIDYEKYINTTLSEKNIIIIDGYSFEIDLIVWQESISEKFCCYYFDEKNVLKGNRTTTFNHNTINFNHSVFVKSAFFDDKENVIDDPEDMQINLFESQEEKKVLKRLHKEIQKLIEKKISVYLSDKAEEVVTSMITERKTFPEFPDDVYGQMRKNDLKRVTKEIFKLEPQIFYKLKRIQEKS